MHGVDAMNERSDEPPVHAYLALMSVFATAYGGLLFVGAKKNRLPKVSARDIALLGVATHRLTRILTRDKVALPLREPFTEVEGTAGAGEMREHPKGRGLRRAIGTLLCCQYCMGPWIASALVAALAVRPRETRVACAMLATTTVSDFLHQSYACVRKASD